MSVTVRISLVFLFICGLGFYFFVRKEMNETKRHYREATEEPLIDFATILAEELATEAKDGLTISAGFRNSFANAYQEKLSAKVYDLQKNKVDLRVYVTNEHGIVIFDSDHGRDEGKDYSSWNDVARTLKGLYGARSSHDDPTTKESILYVAAPIRVDRKIIGSLTVAKPNVNANLFHQAAKRSTLILGIVTFLSAAILAFSLFSLITRPLRNLTLYAQAVRDGKRASLPQLSSGEIRSLGEAFEEMREALEGRKYIERYVQTLTHELKSPLTGIKAAVELLKEDLPPSEREKFMGNIDREAGRIQALIDKLLSLSSLQATRVLSEVEEIQVAELAADVIESLSSVAQAKEITVSCHSSNGVTIHGNKFWLKEALGNLLKNAIDFSPLRSSIEFVISKLENQVAIEIHDHGPGIPEWAQEKIFDQFYSLPRPDTGKKSSGLGLTIVKEVAELHGGKVTLCNREGGGTIAALTLPS